MSRVRKPKPSITPDPTPGTSEPVVKKESKGYATRQAAVKDVVSDVINGLSAGSGKDWVVLTANAVVKTSLRVTVDGRWLLPNDVDRDSLEEITVELRFVEKEAKRD